MKFYERAPYHMISHIVIGFIAAWYSWVGVLAVIYQLMQLVFNVRTFPLEGIIKPENSVAHTTLKLLEIFIGYEAGLITREPI